MINIPLWAFVLLCIGSGFTVIVLFGMVVMLLVMLCACAVNTVSECRKERCDKIQHTNESEPEAPYFTEPNEKGSDK